MHVFVIITFIFIKYIASKVHREGKINFIAVVVFIIIIMRMMLFYCSEVSDYVKYCQKFIIIIIIIQLKNKSDDNIYRISLLLAKIEAFLWS